MVMEHKDINILVVDDEQDYCDVMTMILQGEGYTVDSCNDGCQAMDKLEQLEFHIVVTDLMMPKMDGTQLLGEIKKKCPDIEVIMMTAHGTIEKAVEAMKKGAYSYVTKGQNPEELLAELRKIQELKILVKENIKLRNQLNTTDCLLESKNDTFRNMLDVAEKAADSTANILILGESGVGKEVLARYIHRCSQRRNHSFVDLNCHAIPESVLESELFGHEKGSFTGASYKRIGRFEDAHNGTLFLDEIGDIPLSTQAKLLKVIENRKLYPIGSNRAIDVNFRLLAATNKNLEQEIQRENFRADLFYRLSTIVIEIPSLRQRREDLPRFITYFLEKSQTDMKKNIREVEPNVMEFLLAYDYPGNIRELKNIIERLVVLADAGIVKANHLSNYGVSQNNGLDNGSKSRKNISYQAGENQTLREVRKEVESNYIKRLIDEKNGNLNEIAEILGITRRQLGNKLIEFDIKK